jgi:predicted ATPase/DNA-binding SARP family transcriptional activator
MATAVRVSLLGSIEVSGGPGVKPVPGTKQQALLALLALAVPRTVSADRLVDELWGDEPPAKPANALQALVSHVRRAIGRDAVVRRGTGYELAAGPDDVDAIRLDHLVSAGAGALAEGRADDAASHYGEALELVRGPALTGLHDHRFARDAAARLDGLVLAAREGRVEAELARGRHGGVVDALATLVVEHPLHERFHAQRITALYRCGRQADALRAYQQAREVLADELGIDPGPELQALERAVLAQDPSLDPAASVPLTRASAHRAPPSPLPVALTSFVGRASDRAALEAAVAGSRLVTLVGTGGVGKTRLVVEVARGLAERREVCFVELAPVTTAVAVPEAIASAVGARDDTPAGPLDAPRGPEARAVECLRQRAVVVVVLDNCEHVIEAAADCAATLLTSCPDLTIVATSREPLGIPGEVQVALEPLSEADAVQLFADRAAAVRPQFDPGEEGGGERAELAELCRRLDGLPLAIELAAARTKTLPVPTIVARLDRRFDLLRSANRPGGDGGGGGGEPSGRGGRSGRSGATAARHTGLGAAIDGSYEMLFDGEQHAFRSLAVFAGGFSVQAAEHVCGPDALDLVARLVDRSMVVADTSGTEARFRMLESLRAYGTDRLAEAGELDAARAVHARWCTELAEEAEPFVRGPDQLAWLERLDAEHENLRTALAHATTADPTTALRLIGALVMPWWFRGRRQESRHWVEAALAAADASPAAIDPVALAKALSFSGLVCEAGGWTDDPVMPGGPAGLDQQLALAEARQRRAIELGTGIGDAYVIASIKVLLVVTLARRVSAGVAIDPGEIARLEAEAAPSLAEQGDHYAAASIHIAAATGAIAAGDMGRVAEATEAARVHAERSGDRFSRSRVEWMFGQLAAAAGDPAEAYRHVERSLRLVDELGMAQAVTSQARYLVRYAEESGRTDLAAQWQAFLAGRTPAWTFYDLTATASGHNVEGLAARASGDLDGARRDHTEALAAYRDAGAATGIAHTESCLGFLATASGDDAGATRHHRRSLDAAVEAGEPAALALALEGIASTLPPDDCATAVALLAAASTRWWASGAEPRATHRSDVAALRSRLESTLGADGVAKARAEGSDLTDAQVLLLARSAPRHSGPG